MNEEEIQRIEKIINKCKECRLHECIQCEISYTDSCAISHLYNGYLKYKKENKTLKNALAELFEVDKLDD